MKKIKSKGLLLVVLVILAMGLTACGGKETTESDKDDNTQAVEETADSNKDDSSNDSEEGEEAEEGQEEGQEQEVVIPDEDPTLQFTGFTNAAYGGMDSTVSLYENDIAIMHINYASRDRYFQGSWTKDDETSAITLIIEETEIEMNEAEDGSYSFDYPTFDGKDEVVIPFSTNAE